MRLDKTWALFKRHLPLFISLAIALVFATTHFIIETLKQGRKLEAAE